MAFLIASLIFIGGLVFSFRSQPEIFSNLSWAPVIFLMVVLVPMTLFTNAVEVLYLGQLTKQGFRLPEAFSISILANAANLLPIPGGLLVKTGALKAKGNTLKTSFGATIAIALIWLAVSFIYSGAWLVSYVLWAALIFMVIGFVTFAVMLIFAQRLGVDHILFFKILVLKVVATLIATLRLMVCLMALGVSADFAKSAVMSAASVISSAALIFPGGLGFREFVTAGLGEIIGISAAYGYMAAVLNRFAGIAVLAPVAMTLARMNRPEKTIS